MNKNRFLAAVLAFCLMLTLCACGSDPAPATPPEDSTPSADNNTTPSGENTAPSGETTRPTAPTPAEGQVLYTIKVVDTDGNAKANVAVNLCDSNGCDYKVTDVAGYAYFCKPESDWKAAFSELPEIYYYFEEGTREMTLIYDLGAPATEEPTYNEIEFDNWD